MHFTACPPDYKLLDRPHTPPATLTRARDTARRNGVRYAYTGHVHDTTGGTTSCPSCASALIERDWYELRTWRLTPEGACPDCGTKVPGVFEPSPGTWGQRRMPVRIGMRQ
jgi:pyruvate formate lyase activating enzyme